MQQLCAKNSGRRLVVEAFARGLVVGPDEGIEATDLEAGKVSFEEGKAVHSDWTQDAYASLDADGSLSRTEYQVAVNAQTRTGTRIKTQ